MPDKKKLAQLPRAAQIHAHFTIYGTPQDVPDGDITSEEQKKAIERFIKWHRRQLQLGEALLKQLAPPAAVPIAGGAAPGGEV